MHETDLTASPIHEDALRTEFISLSSYSLVLVCLFGIYLVTLRNANIPCQQELYIPPCGIGQLL